jgi:hypothetical protein
MRAGTRCHARVSSPDTPKLTSSSAVLLVADIERSAQFYAERLGFSCQRYGEPPTFLVVARDGRSS